jgi:hypothetical protein
VNVPSAFAEQRKDIERLSARLHGFGLATAITTHSLCQLSRAEVRSLIDTARTQGLLDDGPAWTVNATAAQNLGKDFERIVEKIRVLDR